MSEAPGYDSAQEQETPGRDPLVPQVFRSWDRPQAFFAIMGHVPPCVQHPQVQADWQGGDAPVTRNDWKEPHRPKTSSSVHKKPLITVGSV